MKNLKMSQEMFGGTRRSQTGEPRMEEVAIVNSNIPSP